MQCVHFCQCMSNTPTMKNEIKWKKIHKIEKQKRLKFLSEEKNHEIRSQIREIEVFALQSLTTQFG